MASHNLLKGTLLELLGIPIWIGQNRSQPVFASWYDDVDCDIIKRGKEGEELKTPHYASTAAIYNYIITYNIIPNTNNFSFVGCYLYTNTT